MISSCPWKGSGWEWYIQLESWLENLVPSQIWFCFRLERPVSSWKTRFPAGNAIPCWKCGWKTLFPAGNSLSIFMWVERGVDDRVCVVSLLSCGITRSLSALLAKLGCIEENSSNGPSSLSLSTSSREFGQSSRLLVVLSEEREVNY